MKNRFLILLLLLTPLVTAQNPRHVISGHPRLLINDTVPDTWEPSKSRLRAVTDRIFGGNAAASSDLAGFEYYITSNPSPGFGDHGTDQNFGLLLAYAFDYMVHHKHGDSSTADAIASTIWTYMRAGDPNPVIKVTSIVTNSSGVATVTLSSAPTPALSVTAGGGGNCFNGGAPCFGIWGASNDLMNGGPRAILSAPTSTTFTYQTSVNGATFTDPQMYFSWGMYGVNEHGDPAVGLLQWAYFYDWCYDWLVANGHDQYARDQIKALYWNNTLTRGSTQFSSQVRESDFHNYTSWEITAIMEAGLALQGDDPFGQTILDEGVGYFWEGTQVNPAGYESYEYNLKKSVDTLTGGAFNWEGPRYWRAGAIHHLRSLEAFDAATNRQNDIWHTQFSTAGNAGMYKVYTMRPDGMMAAFGDSGNSDVFAGRDNFGLAINNDRFPDPHKVWLMDQINDWNDGASSTGLAFKMIFYPYVNGPGSHDRSDLPKAARFGPDVFIFSGWGSTDTFLSYTSSLRGTYHRHEDAGSITLFKNSPLVLGQPYTLVDPAYSSYSRRTIGGNTLTVYDPADCFKGGAACQKDAYGNGIVNDGGQLMSARRLYPQFQNNEFYIARLWSGSLYSDATWGAMYSETFPVSQATAAFGSGYEHIRHDLTKLYRNLYTGTGDNPTVKVASSGGVVREVVHFQATQGTLDPVVIFDRVTATDASFQKAWSMHVATAPTVDGVTSSAGDTTYTGAAVTKVTNDTGRMYISHLLPASPKVRTTGGNACSGAKAASCVWSYYVDQLGPAPITGAHLWDGTTEWEAAKYRPDWAIREMPASNTSTTDYFLNVLMPTATSVGTAPLTSLISAPGVYGVQVNDTSGLYVAVFGIDPGGSSSVTYTATHAGSAKHVVAGLSTGTATIVQGETTIGAVSVDSTGSIGFLETGGGNFRVTLNGTGSPAPTGTTVTGAAMVGDVTIR